MFWDQWWRVVMRPRQDSPPPVTQASTLAAWNSHLHFRCANNGFHFIHIFILKETVNLIFCSECCLIFKTSKRCVLWNMILQSFIGSKLQHDIWIKAVMIVRYTACSTSDIIVNLLTFHRLKVLKVITIRIWPDLMIPKLTPA